MLEKNVIHSYKESNLLHEIIHIINNVEDLRMSESKVERFEKGLFHILKDNNLLK